MASNASEQADGGRFLRRLLLAALVVALALLVWEWRQVLLLVFGSVLIAVGLHAIADPLAARTPLNTSLSLALAALLVLAVLVGVGWLFGAQIAGQMDTLGEKLPKAWEGARNRLEGLPGGGAVVREVDSIIGGAQSGGVQGGVQGGGGGTETGAGGATQDQTGREGGGGSPGSILGRIGGMGLTVFGALMDALVVVVAAIFMAGSPKPYLNGLLKLAPQDVRPKLKGALDETGRALKRWLGATLLSMTNIALLTSLALWLLGVPAFLALGLIAGLAQFVPLVGPVIAAAPGVLLALTVSPETALWTALAYFAITQFDANVVYPIIQKHAVNLPGALTLFAIIAMGVLFGPMGVLLAVPLTVVATIFVKRFYIRDALHDEIKPTAA